MKKILTLILVVHGLIHLPGFIKAFAIAEMEQLLISITPVLGIVWLLTALLFLVAGVFHALGNTKWWIPGVTAVILSQTVIILSWGDAKYGTILNLILLVPAVISAGYTSLLKEFQSVVKNDLGKGTFVSKDNLTEAEISHLPVQVQKYLRYTRSVGKPKIDNFRAEFKGGMRSKPDEAFMSLKSVQYNFYKEPSRYFFMVAKKMGLPASGLHIYCDKSATFRVKVLNWFTVVDAKGEKLTQAETVTLFNDMCLIAPGSLIDGNIEWEYIDDLTVKASYSNGGYTISAVLSFNQKGKLTNFISSDRFDTDGRYYNSYPWSTPVSEYRELNGFLLPGKAKLIYHKPDGDFVYGEMEAVDVQYNVPEVSD